MSRFLWSDLLVAANKLVLFYTTKDLPTPDNRTQEEGGDEEAAMA